MNFSFDESGGISSKALSEQNSNLLIFFTLCRKYSTLVCYNLVTTKNFRIDSKAKLKVFN